MAANELASDYIVFDLETTGFSPIKNNIIEISAIKYNKNKEVDTFSFLVNPLTNIPSVITNLTGISNKDVKSAMTIDEVLPNFLEFIGDYPLVAHNRQI